MSTTEVVGTCQQCCPKCPCSENFCFYYQDEQHPEWTLYSWCGGGLVQTETPPMPCCECPPPDETTGEVVTDGVTSFLVMPCLGQRCECYSCVWQWDALLEDWFIFQECYLNEYGPMSASDNCACIRPSGTGGAHGEQVQSECRCLG